MTTPTKNPAAVALGRAGGKAGTGASKRRNPEHYRRMQIASRLKQEQNYRDAVEKQFPALKPPKAAKRV